MAIYCGVLLAFYVDFPYDRAYMTQKDALDILKLGHNVYLTGAAGSGKTFLLNHYIDYLKQQSIAVGITASTGIAATHMGGVTIHSWSGMGIRDELSPQDITELVKRPYLRKHFAKTRVLIIDEISMLHAHQLDLVDRLCRAFKHTNTPFGGLQVVMCGDFFQLPPVTRAGKKEETDQPTLFAAEKDRMRDAGMDFVTQSDVWAEMNLQICYLDEQHRQDDRTFLRVLNEIRNGDVSEDTIEALTARMDKDIEGYVKPTKLYTHNANVDTINREQLDALPGEGIEYIMSWRGRLPLVEVLKKSCLAPDILTLKIGAQVMFVKNNYEIGYVNGTLGEVVNFDSKNQPLVRTFDGAEILVSATSWEVKEENVEMAAIAQLPLRLAWAITVHKSQGMSLDAAEIDLKRSFIPGMGYVALSRVRSLKGLKLLGINQMALQVNPEVAELDREFVSRSNEAIAYLYAIPPEQKERMQQDVLEFWKGR